MSVYLWQNDQKAGPYTADEILSRLQAGLITTDDLVWEEGMSDWLPLSEFQRLGLLHLNPPPLPQHRSVYSVDDGLPRGDVISPSITGQKSAWKQPKVIASAVGGCGCLCLVGLLLLALIVGSQSDGISGSKSAPESIVGQWQSLDAVASVEFTSSGQFTMIQEAGPVKNAQGKYWFSEDGRVLTMRFTGGVGAILGALGGALGEAMEPRYAVNITGDQLAMTFLPKSGEQGDVMRYRRIQ